MTIDRLESKSTLSTRGIFIPSWRASSTFRIGSRVRIAQHGFVQGSDFSTIHNSMNSPPSIEYHPTLDMAKELSMVERNEKGKAGPAILP
jgi:phage anti-repressor protein